MLMLPLIYNNMHATFSVAVLHCCCSCRCPENSQATVNNLVESRGDDDDCRTNEFSVNCLECIWPWHCCINKDYSGLRLLKTAPTQFVSAATIYVIQSVVYFKIQIFEKLNVTRYTNTLLRSMHVALSFVFAELVHLWACDGSENCCARHSEK